MQKGNHVCCKSIGKKVEVYSNSVWITEEEGKGYQRELGMSERKQLKCKCADQCNGLFSFNSSLLCVLWLRVKFTKLSVGI